MTLALRWVDPLVAAMSEFAIDTRVRVAAFLAQTGHESMGFSCVHELGGPAYLDRYDTGRLASRLGNTPEDDDDGARYCGRGLLQITGRDNYRSVGVALCLPLIEHPELLEEPTNAARSAGWYWSRKHLNELADAQLFSEITRRINGGQNGAADRLKRYHRALDALA